MTPNGAVMFALLVVAGAMLSGRIAGLMVLLALCVAFGALTVRDRMIKALAWSAGIVAPLAVFMAIVWIAVVGRSPAEIAAGVAGTRMAALGYVATICVRLFVVALVIQLVGASFTHLTPLQFIRALRAPLAVKKLLVLTLSWIDTILQAVDRSRTVLVTAGIIAPGVSLRNAANGWILVQTVWLSVITIAVGRLRDKWPTENTLARLDESLSVPAPRLAPVDWWWVSAAVAAIVTARVV
jgi:hypothetical protein